MDWSDFLMLWQEMSAGSPFFLMANKSSTMVWLAENDTWPQQEENVHILFKTQSVGTLDILPEKVPINARYYTNTVLPEVLRNRA